MRSASVMLRCSTSMSDSTSNDSSLPCLAIMSRCSASAGRNAFSCTVHGSRERGQQGRQAQACCAGSNTDTGIRTDT